MMLRLSLAFIALSCAAQAPDTAEVSTRDAPAIFTARVNLVLVPVVVRDKNGKAIGTLKQEDFQLADKGKPQVITRFSIERPEAPVIPSVTAIGPDTEEPAPAAPAGPIPQRFVGYVVDDVHLSVSDLTRARQAVVAHLTESVEPTTR